MPVAMRRRWTAEQVRRLQEEQPTCWPRYELIDGELCVTPSPGFSHHAGVMQLSLALQFYVTANRLGGVGWAPADIELEPGTILQPDVFVFPTLDESIEKPSWKDVTSLLLAIEVISPSSIRTDRVDKRDKYMSLAVDEYWVVDIDGGHIERWFKGRPDVEVARENLVWSAAKAREPLVIHLPDLFQAIRRFGR